MKKKLICLLSALAGAQVNISITADGIKITAGAEEPKQTGIVTTNGGNLNVRTGAGLDNKAFTQLPDIFPLPVPDVSVNTRKGVVVIYAPCQIAI